MTVAAESQQTLAQLVAANPARAIVLDRIGLDFCCHGQRSLSEACASAGLDPGDVAAALDTVSDDIPAGWSGGGRAELASYVESTHHSYLHSELGSLEPLARKFCSRTVTERRPNLTRGDRIGIISGISSHPCVSVAVR